MIEELSKTIPISFLCTHFGISRSGYYSWKSSPNFRSEWRKQLQGHIKIEFKNSEETYGSPRIHAQLKAKGIFCSKNTVAKIMRELRIGVKRKKRFIPQTTNSNHQCPVSPRIFKSEEELPQSPNQIWAGDITYLKVDGEGFYYLSVVMDLYNREIVGWSVDKTLETSGVLNALANAVTLYGRNPGRIFHSDRGSQYASAIRRPTGRHSGPQAQI